MSKNKENGDVGELMENKTKKFEELYGEYKKLVVSTHIEAQAVIPGKKLKVHHIKPDELMRRKDLARELSEDYKEYFDDKPAEWFEIQQDKM